MVHEYARCKAALITNVGTFWAHVPCLLEKSRSILGTDSKKNFCTSRNVICMKSSLICRQFALSVIFTSKSRDLKTKSDWKSSNFNF